MMMLISGGWFTQIQCGVGVSPALFVPQEKRGRDAYATVNTSANPPAPVSLLCVYDALESVAQHDNVEINDQPELKLHGLEVCQRLRQMQFTDGFDNLKLEHKDSVHKQVHSPVSNMHSFVKNFRGHFLLVWN